MKRWFLTMALVLAGAPWGRAAYADLVTFFDQLSLSSDAAVFPVSGRSLTDIESAFGPRIQTSTDLYDWHRGIDVDGTLNTDAIVAPLKGTFYDYRTTSSGGNIVILEHRFADFLGGNVTSISYGGKSLTKFYTWHLHLYDDGIAGNGIGTDDLVAGFTVGQAIARGTQIGILGNSGSAAAGGDGYGPHLHFELRLGTNSSVEFQLANPGTTQWGFDPHMNPMFLFAEPTVGSPAYSPTLTTINGFTAGQNAVFRFATGNDDYPLLNRWSVVLRSLADNSVAKSYVLDYNQRTGYDPTSTATLDTKDASVPYVDPIAFTDTATDFRTNLVVPSTWLSGYTPGGYQLEVTATDLWGNPTTTVSAVPEPALTGALFVGCLGLAALVRRRRSPR